MLEAIPLPDPRRRGRDKHLPRGEIPDALHPPAGCRFHPRCPQGFEVCGWEGRDLIDHFEDRWTRVDEVTFEAELAAVGALDEAEVSRYEVRFRHGDPARLVPLLERLRAEGDGRVFSAVTGIERDDGAVVVRFGEGPEPALQPVAGREVACHLHGVVPRRDSPAVGW